MRCSTIEKNKIMLKKFRDNQFRKALNKRKAGITRVVLNASFDDSSSFLLLFDCTTEEKYNEFSRISASLQIQHKKVKGVGFHGLAALPPWCQQSLSTVYIGKQDFNASGLPTGNLVEDIIAEPFDVLIDLTQIVHPVFHWIVCLSAAHLKIGTPARKNQHIFDISIDAANQQSQEEMMKLAIQFQNMFQKK